MATIDTTATSVPVLSNESELWYSIATSGDGRKQVFDIQSIPPVDTAPDDQEYNVLESKETRSVPGLKPYESIEIEILFTKRDFLKMKALENQILFWQLKLPDDSAPEDEEPLSLNWKGKCYIALGSLESGDLINCTLKIYKSSDVAYGEGLLGDEAA